MGNDKNIKGWAKYSKVSNTLSSWRQIYYRLLNQPTLGDKAKIEIVAINNGIYVARLSIRGNSSLYELKIGKEPEIIA